MPSLQEVDLQLSAGVVDLEPAIVVAVMEIVIGLWAEGKEEIVPALFRPEVRIRGIQDKLDLAVQAVQHGKQHVVELGEEAGVDAQVEIEISGMTAINLGIFFQHITRHIDDNSETDMPSICAILRQISKS